MDMASLQSHDVDVEVKVFRGQPRIYIRYKTNNSYKKGNVKSLTCEEWQAMKNCMLMIDQQLSNMSNESKSDESIITQTVCGENSQISDLNAAFSAALEPSQSEPEALNCAPKYFVDEKAVAELLAIFQQTEQQLGIFSQNANVI